MPTSLHVQTLQHPPRSVEGEGAGPLKHSHFAAEICRRLQICIFLLACSRACSMVEQGAE